MIRHRKNYVVIKMYLEIQLKLFVSEAFKLQNYHSIIVEFNLKNLISIKTLTLSYDHKIQFECTYLYYFRCSGIMVDLLEHCNVFDNKHVFIFINTCILSQTYLFVSYLLCHA